MEEVGFFFITQHTLVEVGDEEREGEEESVSDVGFGTVGHRSKGVYEIDENKR